MSDDEYKRKNNRSVTVLQVVILFLVIFMVAVSLYLDSIVDNSGGVFIIFTVPFVGFLVGLGVVINFFRIK